MIRFNFLLGICLMVVSCSVDTGLSENSVPTITESKFDDADVKVKSVTGSNPRPTLDKREIRNSKASLESSLKETSPAALVTSPSKKMANTSYWIQLAAASSLRKADEESTRLQETWPEIFETKELVIIEKNTAILGTIFRVQTGGFATLQEAQSICAAMHAEKQGCFVLKR